MIGRERIEAVLNRIRPLLQSDGSDVELVDMQEGCVVSLRFTSLCRQCAAAPLTMHEGLTEIFREEIPEFSELRLV